MSIFDIFRSKNDPNNQAAAKPEVPEAPKTPSPVAQPAGGSTSVPTGVPKVIESTCPAPGVFGAVDLSQPVTQHFLDVVGYLGVKTIIRYYDYPNESLKGKTPHLDEIAMIGKNGFKMLGVFQHSNNSIATFQTPGRGTKDATRSVELATLWKQPKGSCIYFGVDFDPSLGSEMTAVKGYAADFAKVARAAGYRVGAYGSGLTLETLASAGLIDLTWLSMSTGFQHSKAFAASMNWNLHQVKDRTCGQINCDFNYDNPGAPDYGQWTVSL